MILDLRLPLFVITGTWNVAIFTPAWIAIHLFDVAKGSEAQFTEVMVASPGPRQILYYGEVGLSVSPGRIEIFMNGLDADNAIAVESTAKRIIERLPHTPLGAFGVNLTYAVPEPTEELVDLLKCADKLNERFLIKSSMLKDTIRLQENVDLNLTRTIAEGTVVVEYNFHHKPITFENHAGLINGACKRYLEETKRINVEVYGLEEFETETFALRKI